MGPQNGSVFISRIREFFTKLQVTLHVLKYFFQIINGMRTSSHMTRGLLAVWMMTKVKTVDPILRNKSIASHNDYKDLQGRKKNIKYILA